MRALALPKDQRIETVDVVFGALTDEAAVDAASSVCNEASNVLDLPTR